MDEVRTLLEDIRERLVRIENILLGNGQEALIREVAKNSDFRLRYEKMWRAMAAAAAGALFTGLVALARTFIN